MLPHRRRLTTYWEAAARAPYLESLMALFTTFTRLPDVPRHASVLQSTGGVLLRGGARVLLVVLGASLLGACLVVAYYSVQPGLVVRVNAESLSLLDIVVVLAALYGAWVFAARRKELILFLRRFGQSSANDAISGALYGSLGGQARLVVLDDSVFRPISIPPRQRLLILVSTFPVFIVLGLVLALGASVLGDVRIEGGGVSIAQRGFISIGPATSGLTDKTAYAEGPALLQFPQAIPLWIALAGVGFIAWRAFGGSWEARRRIDRQADLDRLVRRTRWLTRRASSPKALGTVATVISSSDGMWQKTVATLAHEAAKIVLDVSFPTAPILWELQLCVEQYPDKLLLLMDAADNYRSRHIEVDEAALAELVGRSAYQGILTYDLGDPNSRASLHRDLQAFANR